VIHASAALYHHFWRCDDTLNAMLPQILRRRIASPFASAADDASEIERPVYIRPSE
jgi:hypothetical protein